MRPDLRRLLEVVEAGDPQVLVEQRDGLGSDALQPQHVEQRGGKLGQQLLPDAAVAGHRDLANAAGQVLADARPRPQARIVQAGTGSAALATTSAPLRYARILNGFSPFSSSRSRFRSAPARSRGYRAATAGWRSLLVDVQPGGLDAEVEQPRAAGGERLADGRHACPAAPGRTGSRRRRRRRPWPPAAPAAIARAIRSSMAGVVTPGASRLRFSHSSARHCAVASQSPLVERLAHRGGGVANALEAVEDVTVAVDVPLRDVPVVGAGIARLAGVAEDEARFRARGDRRRAARAEAVPASSSSAAMPPYIAGR